MLILLATIIVKIHRVVKQQDLGMDTLSCTRDTQQDGKQNFKLKDIYPQQNQNTQDYQTP